MDDAAWVAIANHAAKHRNNIMDGGELDKDNSLRELGVDAELNNTNFAHIIREPEIRSV